MTIPFPSGVGPNPPGVEAGSAGERNNSPASGSLGRCTAEALAVGAKLTVSRNRSGSFTAEVAYRTGCSIAGTMPSPNEALAQLESALQREYDPPV